MINITHDMNRPRRCVQAGPIGDTPRMSQDGNLDESGAPRALGTRWPEIAEPDSAER